MPCLIYQNEASLKLSLTKGKLAKLAKLTNFQSEFEKKSICTYLPKPLKRLPMPYGLDTNLIELDFLITSTN